MNELVPGRIGVHLDAKVDDGANLQFTEAKIGEDEGPRADEGVGFLNVSNQGPGAAVFEVQQLGQFAF